MGSTGHPGGLEMDPRRVPKSVGRRRARVGSGEARSTDPPASDTPRDSLAEWERLIVDEARPYTMTSVQRLVAAIDAAGFVVRRGIPGALVECGVWKGGSVLAMIRALQR